MRLIPTLPVFSVILFTLSACHPPEEWTQREEKQERSGTELPELTNIEIEVREDGLVVEKGTEVPFTGTLVVPDKVAEEEGKPGRRMSVPYQDGRMHGVRVKYFPSGRVVEERVYEHGVPKSSLSYFSSGAKKYEISLNAEDKGEGPYRRWHENGQLQSEGTFNANERFQGEFKEYDTEGNLIGHYIWEDQKILQILFESEEQKANRLERYGKVEGE